MKFVVTAGHSITDPGAVANGVREADLARELRNIVGMKLQDRGHTVISDGKVHENWPLGEARRLIQPGTPAVEIHFNAATNPAATGVETIALSKDKALAQRISKGIANVLGMRLRGDAGYIDQSKSARGKLGFVSAGGLIIEVCFISNPTDLSIYQAKKWLVASAIADALENRN